MYLAPDMTRWKGRVDAAEGELGRRWHQIVRPFDVTAIATATEHSADANPGTGIALIGFASDAGVARNHGRPGASAGPAALRALLANMPVRHCADIAEAGDVICVASGDDDGLEHAQQELAACVARILATGALPLVMGGGHEVAFGSFSGLVRHLETQQARATPPRIGIINLDAHFDLRMAERASSGTPFRQIAEECAARGWPFHYCCLGVSEFANTEALFTRARSLGVTWVLDEAMDQSHVGQVRATVEQFLNQVDHVYFTICLDVLPAAIAPGVSAPSARGVALDVIEPIVDQIAASGKLRVADIAELNPAFDVDQRTARVGARLLTRVAERYSAPREKHDGNR